MDLVFPIILFEKNDSKMFSLNYKFLMGDIRHKGIGFKKVDIIDSTGRLIHVKDVEQVSGLKLWESIKLVGLIVKLNPIVEGEVSYITLNELKNRVLQHLSRHVSDWSYLGPPSEIEQSVERASSFKDLIMVFNILTV